MSLIRTACTTSVNRQWTEKHARSHKLCWHSNWNAIEESHKCCDFPICQRVNYKHVVFISSAFGIQQLGVGKIMITECYGKGSNALFPPELSQLWFVLIRLVNTQSIGLCILLIWLPSVREHWHALLSDKPLLTIHKKNKPTSVGTIDAQTYYVSTKKRKKITPSKIW